MDRSAQGQKTPPATKTGSAGAWWGGCSGGQEMGTTAPASRVQSTPARASSGRWKYFCRSLLNTKASPRWIASRTRTPSRSSSPGWNCCSSSRGAKRSSTTEKRPSGSRRASSSASTSTTSGSTRSTISCSSWASVKLNGLPGAPMGPPTGARPSPEPAIAGAGVGWVMPRSIACSSAEDRGASGSSGVGAGPTAVKRRRMRRGSPGACTSPVIVVKRRGCRARRLAASSRASSGRSSARVQYCTWCPRPRSASPLANARRPEPTTVRPAWGGIPWRTTSTFKGRAPSVGGSSARPAPCCQPCSIAARSPRRALSAPPGRRG